MKEEITNIINQVSNRTISTDEAIEDLLHLFNVSKCEEDVRKALLLAFIKEIQNEFKYENWDYLYFIAGRLVSRQ